MTTNSADELERRIKELEAQLNQKNIEIAGLRPFQYMADENRISLEIGLAKATAELQVLQNHVESLRNQCPRYRNQEMMCLKPYWKPRNIASKESLCFLLMPFKEVWSDRVWAALEHSATKCGFDCVRADQRHGRLVLEDIWQDICSARVVIADLTGSNPNVTYEVGMADVVGANLILLSQTTNPRKIPFDFLGQRLLRYEFSDSGIAKLTDEVDLRLARIRKNAA
jgi:hypothetical protein